MNYDAFISYRRSDGGRVARWLRRELQSFRMPKRLRGGFGRQMRVYLDTAYERATPDFYRDTIRPALMASRHLILVVTPDMLATRNEGEDWVLREIADFSSGPHAGNILIVRGGGEFNDPLPGSLAEDFPNIEIVDLRGAGRLNIINTFRLGRLTAEKLKIVATLLGVPPEAMPLLRQEQERAQQARIGLIAGTASAIVVGVAGLAVYALQSAWRAEQALARSQQTTSSVVGAISRLPGVEGLDNPRALALAISCDLYDQLSEEALEDQDPSITVTCAIERARAFEVHKDFAQAERALLFAVSVAKERRLDFVRGSPENSAHEARMALAGFLERRGRMAEVRELAETMVKAAAAELDPRQPISAGTTGAPESDLITSELVSALDRRIDAGALLGRLHEVEGEINSAIAAYAALDSLIEARERARLLTEARNAGEDKRQHLAAAERAKRATYARRRARLLRGQNTKAAHAALTDAVARLRETEELAGTQSIIDLRIANVLAERLSLGPLSDEQADITHVQEEIRARLKRVWDAASSSGVQRRRAQEIWQQVSRVVDQPASDGGGSNETSD